MLINTLVTLRLDYANAILHGLPSTQIKRLQRLQNLAAWLVAHTKKHAHIFRVHNN